ncbi:TetR family transcriptional regulator [Streptomyces kaniharaensis]|uniref:TetR family transcriptional regulator n=1 Tax=Streptomyces kaniharaensis TaxID=212423 RepID=A0A6N7KN99_9ACTN|nr:TetR family transcriptional regulator [Streptomyces kaniharaensis]MQS12049.1 TetR family transcriptional regulator [Streptomyces kaniharaensis]
MNHTVGARQAQKQQSRRALLDAGLGLLADQNLASLGVREVTRAAGLSPAAFYRHFPDLAALGVALVEESLASLHVMIRSVLTGAGGAEELIDRAVDVIQQHVREHRPHVRFLARERHGGVRRVREAIDAELGRFAEEVCAALRLQSASKGWSEGDLRMLAELYVDHMVSTAAAFLEALDAQEADPAREARIAATARLQLRLISLGRRHWQGS